jgi:hypothetical protein
VTPGVTIENCAIYQTQFGVRVEDNIQQLKLIRMAWGGGVSSRVGFHGGKTPPGFKNVGETTAPPIEQLVTRP